ncbi:hypothetical protein HWV62_39377 [Athelia sp. TMB]|nr:hypothetical protein HWV62_39377 [Athelia sp. TMB]
MCMRQQFKYERIENVAITSLNSEAELVISSIGDPSMRNRTDICAIGEWLVLAPAYKRRALLAANKNQDRTLQAGAWLSAFLSTLQQLGWITSPGAGFSQLSNPAQFGTVDKAVLKILQMFLSPAQLQLFDSTVQSFKENQAAIDIFDGASKVESEDAATFLAGVADPTRDGNISVNISYINYQASGEITNTFFNSLTGDRVSLNQGFQTIILNSDIYSSLRDTIEDKLRDYKSSLIEDI